MVCNFIVIRLHLAVFKEAINLFLKELENKEKRIHESHLEMHLTITFFTGITFCKAKILLSNKLVC